MIAVSDEYKKAIKETVRKLNAYVELLVDGKYIRGHEQYGEISSQDKAEITVLDTVIDDNSEFVNYASLEQDYFVLDGSFILPNRSNNKSTGFVGDINSSSLNINNIDYDPRDEYLNKKNITIYFENGYATDFTVILEVDYGEVNLRTITYNFTNNTKKTITTEPINDLNGFKNIKNIIIDVNNWSENNHRVRIKQVNLGETIIYESNEIIDINIVEQTDIYNIDLPNNNCSIKLNNYDRKFNVVDENNVLNRLNVNSIIRIYYGININGDYEYICMGNYNFNSYEDNNNQYTVLNGVGYIELLSEENPYLLFHNDFAENTNQVIENFDISATFDSDVKYNQIIPMEYTNFNNKREQLQSLAILSESIVKQTREEEYDYSNNVIKIFGLKNEIVDIIELDRILEQPKFTKKDIINKFIMNNTQLGSLNDSEQVIDEELIIPYYDLKNNDYRYELFINSYQAIKLDTIKIYINNSLYNNYYIEKDSYYQVNIILFGLNNAPSNLKITAKTYEDKKQVYNYSLGNGKLIEYNNNYLRTIADKRRIANYNVKIQKPYTFEFEMLYDPSLEIADTIIFENIDGYKKGIITSIESKFNGALTATIKGECENVL